MLEIQVNPTLGTPIYRQIMDAIRTQIAAGMLKPGEQLPSIRELSARLRINPSSAVKAYSELKHAGIITLDHGRGTFVSSNATVVDKDRDELLDLELSKLLQRTRWLGFRDREVVRALLRLARGEPKQRRTGGRKA